MGQRKGESTERGAAMTYPDVVLDREFTNAVQDALGLRQPSAGAFLVYKKETDLGYSASGVTLGDVSIAHPATFLLSHDFKPKPKPKPPKPYGDA